MKEKKIQSEGARMTKWEKKRNTQSEEERKRGKES